jgi:hypothetical protein
MEQQRTSRKFRFLGHIQEDLSYAVTYSHTRVTQSPSPSVTQSPSPSVTPVTRSHPSHKSPVPHQSHTKSEIRIFSYTKNKSSASVTARANNRYSIQEQAATILDTSHTRKFTRNHTRTSRTKHRILIQRAIQPIYH